MEKVHLSHQKENFVGFGVRFFKFGYPVSELIQSLFLGGELC